MHPAERFTHKPVFTQVLFNRTDQAAFNGAAAAIEQKNACAAAFLHQSGAAHLGVLSKDNLCRSIIIKIEHRLPSLSNFYLIVWGAGCIFESAPPG